MSMKGEKGFSERFDENQKSDQREEITPKPDAELHFQVHRYE